MQEKLENIYKGQPGPNKAEKSLTFFSNIDKTVCKACRNVDAFQNGTKEKESEKFLFLEMSEHKNQSKGSDHLAHSWGGLGRFLGSQ